MEWEALVEAIIVELANPQLRATLNANEQLMESRRDEMAGVIEQAFARMGLGILTRETKTAAERWAAQVSEHAAALEALLADPPFPMRYTQRPLAVRSAGAATMLTDELLEVVTEYEETGLTWLRRKRLDCEQFVADMQAPTARRRGPEIDFVLRYCTILSALLITRFSDIEITTSGPEGSLFVISNLLIEALTGRSREAGGGLRPHCDWVRENLPTLIEGYRGR
jgi:hypothetical protein